MADCCDIDNISHYSHESECSDNHSELSSYSSKSKCSITSKWSKAFNEKTLNQQQNTIYTMIDGMNFNIDDAKNTITQCEQYLTIIYELLVACQDQVMKASVPSRTESDFCSASLRIKEYVNEINKIVLSAQYNGRYLLTDTSGCDSDVFESDNVTSIYTNRESIIFRFAGPRGYVRNVGATLNDFEFVLPSIGPCSLGLAGQGGGYIANATVGNTDYVEATDVNTLNFYQNGLNNWSTTDTPNVPSDEGIVPNDTASDDDVDATVTAFNNAIKLVGIEIDKMRAYRFILFNRLKQIKIYKDGQKMSFDLRKNM